MSRARRVAQQLKGGLDATLGRGTDFSPQPLGRRIDPGGLAGYWCDLSHKARYAAADPDGLPRDGITGALDAWVIPMAQAALGHWELRLAGEDPERAEAAFLRFADWLLAEATPWRASAGEGGEHGEGVAWPIALPVAKYGLTPGWISAMGQSEAISVLLRAQALTGEPRYGDAARAALAPLTVAVERGGVQREVEGRLVLEEYPATAPVAVLNGWIFALFGVHELATATGDGTAGALRDRSLGDLIELLPRYDAGWWSLYSLPLGDGVPDLAKPFYQRLHPVLLEALHLIHPDPRLLATAARWRGQLTGVTVARAAADKLAYRLRRARTGHVADG